MKRTELRNLLRQMTLHEKLAQLTQLDISFLTSQTESELTGPAQRLPSGYAARRELGSVLGGTHAELSVSLQRQHLEESRLPIPLLLMADVVHGFRTIFPIPLALGGSFDPALCEETCRAAAKEASSAGLHVTFAPMVDLVRDSRWGRVMESTGEDPYLNAQMAAASVRGYQGHDLQEPGRMAACVKHFAGYGASEGGRDYNTVDLSEGMLREYYLSSYQAAAKEGAAMFMTSFNTMNRIPCSANSHLLQDILRKEWGFDGVVISDFGAVMETIPHGLSADAKEAAEKCLRAGTDIEMMTTCYLDHIESLVAEGKIDETLVDEAVWRVLELKNRLGLFENPYKDADPVREKAVCFCQEHRDLARRAGQESCVLLQNNGVLPLKKSLKVGIAGPFASSKKLLGSWSFFGYEDRTVTLADGISEKTGPDKIRIAMDTELGSLRKGETDVPDDIQEACRVLADCDVLIAAIGAHPDDCGEAASLVSLGISPHQEALVRAFRQTGKPVVSVIFTGRPLELGEICANSDAVLLAWFPGSEGGHAVADLLYGDCNPSGRLSISLPRSVGQMPLYYNRANTGRPLPPGAKRGSFVTGYLDCDFGPLFPFGYGLSYSAFRYSDLQISGNTLPLQVSVLLENISDRAGTETVQLYIRDIAASVVRPIRELKCFQRVHLEPGEKQRVCFTVNREMLSFYNQELQFVYEPGEFEFILGPHAEGGCAARIFLE